MTDENGDDLKTFDMYHFFSRVDVLLAVAAIVIILLFVLFSVFQPQVA